MARQRRTRPTRERRTRILVVTEGTSTEPQYLEGLQSALRSNGSTTVVQTHGLGKDPVAVVKHCIGLRKQKKDFDYYFCLVDVDEHAGLDSAIRLAQDNDVSLLVSNAQFEIWLLWHVEATRGHRSPADLARAMKKHGLLTGKKAKDIPRDFPFHRVHEAAARARAADEDLAANRAGPNPSSAMPELIDLMLDSVKS